MTTNLLVHDARIQEILVDESPRLVATGFQFTEGAVWHAATDSLLFSDIAGDAMFRLTGDEVTPYRQPSRMANGNTFDRMGRLLTCEHATSRVIRQEPHGSLTVVADAYEGRELNSPNDVVVDAAGRVLFTDPPYGRVEFFGVPRPLPQDVCGVYAVDPGDKSRIRRLADDFAEPNGLCFSPDGRTLYVNDTARGHIRAFEYDDGELRGGEVWAEVRGEGDGVPDGLKVDSAGNVFCTGPGGVHVFDQGARHLGAVLVPEPVANFTWGGADRRTLYLCATTSIYAVPTVVPGT